MPYAVAATLVLKVFQEWQFVEDATVMVQSEVADRICARTHTKAYGAYTAKLRLFAQVEDRFQVPARSFYPAPHVESAVIRLNRREQPLAEGEAAQRCVDVIDAAFAQRRKTIRNSMGADGRWSKDVLGAAFASCGIDPACRAETLEVEQFVELSNALVC